jgi:hypothetical protein
MNDDRRKQGIQRERQPAAAAPQHDHRQQQHDHHQQQQHDQQQQQQQQQQPPQQQQQRNNTARLSPHQRRSLRVQLRRVLLQSAFPVRAVVVRGKRRRRHH